MKAIKNLQIVTDCINHINTINQFCEDTGFYVAYYRFYVKTILLYNKDTNQIEEETFDDNIRIPLLPESEETPIRIYYLILEKLAREVAYKIGLKHITDLHAYPFDVEGLEYIRQA